MDQKIRTLVRAYIMGYTSASDISSALCRAYPDLNDMVLDAGITDQYLLEVVASSCYRYYVDGKDAKEWGQAIIQQALGMDISLTDSWSWDLMEREVVTTYATQLEEPVRLIYYLKDEIPYLCAVSKIISEGLRYHQISKAHWRGMIGGDISQARARLGSALRTRDWKKYLSRQRDDDNPRKSSVGFYALDDSEEPAADLKVDDYIFIHCVAEFPATIEYIDHFSFESLNPDRHSCGGEPRFAYNDEKREEKQAEYRQTILNLWPMSSDVAVNLRRSGRE